jgi:hypothetical protein
MPGDPPVRTCYGCALTDVLLAVLRPKQACEQRLVAPHVVLLVVVLGDPEDRRGTQLGGQLLTPLLRLLCRRRTRHARLLLAVGPQHGLVLRRPHAATLVVRAPEHFQEIGELDLLRVKLDLNGFRVIAQVVVAGLVLLAACVADACPQDTRETPEPGVRSPESPEGEGGNLHPRTTIGIRLDGDGNVGITHDDSKEGEDKTSCEERACQGAGYTESAVLHGVRLAPKEAGPGRPLQLAPVSTPGPA